MIETKPTILMVDDHTVTRLLMRQALKDDDYHLIEAEDALQAIALFKQYQPDVTLLDVSMPIMDGFSCCRKLRELPGGKQAAIIMVTSLDRIEDIEQAFDAGATDFMIKPLKWPLFTQRIRYTLKATRSLRELNQNRSRLEKAQTIANLVYWEWDFESDFLEHESDFNQLLGFTDKAESISITTILDLMHPDDRAAYLDNVMRAEKYKKGYDIEYRVVLTDGQVRYLHERTEVYRDGEIWRINGILHDISLRKQSEQEISYYAFYDTLTNLPNRRAFIGHLERAMKRASSDLQALTLLFIDLDKFKQINDTYGHHIGDSLLRETAKRLKQCLRVEDLVAVAKEEENQLARLAGDEFTVLLSGIERLDTVASIAQRVIDILSEPFILHDKTLFISASIGIAMFPEDGSDPETLLKHADIAMYHAKQSGRNNYQFYSVRMNAYLHNRLQLENDLRTACDKGEFVLYYQCQNDAKNEQIIGFEALLRWQHPTRGLLTPDKFIEIAESGAYIIQIGEWIMQKASMQAKQWQDLTGRPIKISVNVSAVQFKQQVLLKQVKNCLELSGIEPHTLVLEITETAVLNQVEETIPLLRMLKDLGVGLAIDDFGTGYSSLSYLKHFPVDTLKVDKSFVDDIVTHPADAAIARTIIQLAENLGMSTTAEGVETLAQAELLREMNCQEIQGYYYSRPLPEKEAEQLLLNSLIP